MLIVSSTTPRELLYIKMGLLDIEVRMNQNRINFHNRVATSNKEISHKLTRNVNKGSWKATTYKISDEYDSDMDDLTRNKEKTKGKILNRIRKKFQEMLRRSGKKKLKVNFFF